VVEIDINGKGLSYKDVNQLCNEPTGFQAFEYELTYCADYPNYVDEGYVELRIDFTIIGEQTKWFDVQTNIGLPNGKYILVDNGDYYILEVDEDSYQFGRVLIEDCPPVTYQSWFSEPTYCDDYPNYNDLEYQSLRTYSEAGEDGMYWFEQTESIGITLSIGEYIVNLNENDYYLLEVDSDGKELSFDEILNCPPPPPSFTAYVNQNPMYGGTWFDTETLCDDWNGLSYSTITIYIDQYPDGIYYTDEELTILLSTTLGGFLVVDFGGEAGLSVIELDNNSIAINDLGDPDTLCGEV
jgi:hypothetical protein